MGCFPGMRAVEVRHAGRIEIDGRCGGTGGVAQPVAVGASQRGGSGTSYPADAERTTRRGDCRRPGRACQHGAQLAGLLCAWRGGGATTAQGARTAVHDRAACRGDRGLDPERRYAPRRRPGRWLDAGAPVRRDRPAWRGGDLGAQALAPTAPKGVAFRRPRHTLKGRQDAAAVAASRERLAALKTQAAAGAIDLLFLDESEALTHPYLARCWARRGANLRIEAPGQSKKRAMLGAFDPVSRRVLVHTSPTVALPRLCRSAGSNRRCLRHHQTHPTAGRGARQWTHPPQQADNKGARPAPLAHPRMAAEIRPRTERYRTMLARPQAALSRQSHRRRSRRSRTRDLQRRRAFQPRTTTSTLAHSQTICLVIIGHCLAFSKNTSPARQRSP